MSVKVYGIIDEDLGITAVFNMANDAIAIRAFTEDCNKKDTPFNKYPEKFKLVKICEVNEMTGAMLPCKFEKLLGADQCILKSEKSTSPAQ